MAIKGLTFLGLLLCSACTIVRIEGQATPKFGFGVLHIVPTDQGGTVSVVVSGVGVVPTFDGLAVGYVDARRIVLHDANACTVLIDGSNRLVGKAPAASLFSPECHFVGEASCAAKPCPPSP